MSSSSRPRSRAVAGIQSWMLLVPASLISLAAVGLLVRTDAPSHTPPAETTVEEAGNPSGALRALESWGRQRAYPDTKMPDMGYGLAMEQSRTMRVGAGGLDDLVAPWAAIGPANVGGRTLCLAIDPLDADILYAGSASGGLWRSTTGGVGADAWDYVDTGYPVLGVSTIAIEATDPDVIYIGTGEGYRFDGSIGGEVIRTMRGSYGIGILKSTDGGATWSKSLDWTYQQSKGVWMIRIHPTDADIVYAATTDGVYKSLDAGASWNLVHDVVMAMDVRIHPTLPSTVFASCGNFSSTGHGIYRSTDDGASWTKLTSGLPSSWSGKCQLAIAPTTPSTIFASVANEGSGIGLYRSTNTGDTWTQVSGIDYPRYQGWYSHYVVVSPFDDQTLFTGGIEIWRSTTGGSSLSERSRWQDVFFGTSPPEGPLGGVRYAHADHHGALWHPTDPNTVFFASDGGVFKTTDLGNTFQSLIGGYQTSQFYNGFSNSGTQLGLAIGGLQDNFTVIYDGTTAWRRVIGGDGAWTAINPDDDDTMFASYQYLNILRSRDGGSGWSDVTPPDQGGDVTPFVGAFVMCAAEPQVLYAGRARVYRTDDEGSSWSATHGGAPLSAGNPVLSLAVSALGADTAYAATAPLVSRARVFRTRNGSSWTEITGPLPDRYPSDIAVDPNDADRVVVTFLGFGVSHVWKSLNGGDTWTDIGAGLPDIPASAVAVDPDHEDVLYVGTDLGVYLSIDGGTTWQPFTVGMPQAMVNDLKIVSDFRVMRAATHGNGAFERDLYDPTTIDVASVPAVPQVGLDVHPNPVVATSRVRLRVPEAGPVEVSLFNARGQRVAVLVDELRPAGSVEIPLDPAGLSAGVYYVRVEAGAARASTRIVYVR